MEEYLLKLKESISKISLVELSEIEKQIFSCRKRRGTVYIFGNGGSGSSASHVAGDYSKSIRGLKIVCLNDNLTFLTATANDIKYEDVFLEAMKDILVEDDLVIAISGSGNSQNVIKAVSFSNSIGVKTIGLSGFDGGELKDIVSINLHIPVNNMEIIEDLHLSCFHAIKRSLKKRLLEN